MNQPAIILKNITKQYYLEKPRTFKKWFSHIFSPFDKFTVIKNFSLSVNKGDFVIITGPNGSGKTTLLKLIAGITKPDKGKITTYGKIVPIIELSAGFNTELTGRENIMINAAVLGIDKSQIKKNVPKIINFSGIKKFIDVPLKRYSSGMVSRLAFAIAIFSKPDILLLDEIFTIGDKKFRNKSISVIKNLLQSGVTILLNSHWDINSIKPNKIISLKNIL